MVAINIFINQVPPIISLLEKKQGIQCWSLGIIGELGKGGGNTEDNF